MAESKERGWLIALIGVGVAIIAVIVTTHFGTQANIREVRVDVTGVGRSVAALEEKVGSVNQSIASLEQRIEGFDGRLDGFGERLANLEGSLQMRASGDGAYMAEEQAPIPIDEPMGAMDEEAAAEAWAEASAAIDEPIEVAMAEEAEVRQPPDVVLEASVVVADFYEEATPAPPATLHSDESTVLAYIIAKETDSSLGDVRRRIILEIVIGDDVDPLSLTAVEIMTLAARIRHKDDSPDAVAVRLWRSYESGGNALNSIVYAPDGCGWAGTDCTGAVWTELPTGAFP